MNDNNSKRQYLGSVVVNKAYAGEKTINWLPDAEQGRILARLIAEASDQAVKFDLKVARKPRKDGRYSLTVTYAAQSAQLDQSESTNDEDAGTVEDMDFSCPSCQRDLTVPAQYAGQLMKCPLCQNTFQAPALPPG